MRIFDMNCPLCHAKVGKVGTDPIFKVGTDPIFIDEKKKQENGVRPYYACPSCALIFLPRGYHLSPQEEKERYDLHQNDPSDKGYVQFLNQLIEPLVPFLKEGMRGLDYGCGPGPTVSLLLKEKGFTVEDYDPIYQDHKDLLEQQYDFVTSTEVVEHFAYPDQEFKRLHGLLKEGGILAVMTQMLKKEKEFKDWWYWREPSHVAFYQPETFLFIAREFGMQIIWEAENVVFLQK